MWMIAVILSHPAKTVININLLGREAREKSATVWWLAQGPWVAKLTHSPDGRRWLQCHKGDNGHVTERARLHLTGQFARARYLVGGAPGSRRSCNNGHHRQCDQ